MAEEEEKEYEFLDEIAATTAESNAQDAVVGRWRESSIVAQRDWIQLWRIVRTMETRAALAELASKAKAAAGAGGKPAFMTFHTSARMGQILKALAAVGK